ncbi:uncharacterized protein DS421_9g276210 [Arachis hypogaea]|nr:uncharacterized protein DS421_9g276210 [Arachis hypogaea]
MSKLHGIRLDSRSLNHNPPKNVPAFCLHGESCGMCGATGLAWKENIAFFAN